MSLKTLIAAVDGGPGDDETLAAAAWLAARCDAVASAVMVYPDAAADMVALGAGFGAYITPQMYSELEAAERQTQSRIGAACTAAAAAAGVAFGDGSETPRLALAPRERRSWLALAVHAVLSDVLVVSRRSLRDGAMSVGGLLGEALLQARLPVLITHGDPGTLSGVAAIAWDGSAQAGRAIRAALPLLGAAERVLLLQAPKGLAADQKVGADFERLEAYLTLHGVGSIARRTVDGDHEGPALLAAATELGAGLLVAGAYGHSRLRESLFGGATRSFVGADGGPHLLLAH